MNELIELLSLPEKSEIDRHLPTGVRVYGYTASDMKTYARACVAHATAAKDTEIEALRVEVAKLRNLRADAIHECALANTRAERLAEALRDARDYVTTALREEREKFAGHEDCSNIPGIEADLHKIDSALNPTAAQDGK